jgi:hypothetical protein
MKNSPIWQRFQTILESHHPYHFTEANYAKLLSARFDIVCLEDIEEDVIWINNETSDQKIPPLATTPLNQSQLTRGQRIWQAIVTGRAVTVLFLHILSLLGWPAHDFIGTGRSLYRHKLFVLQPKR